MTVDNEMMIKFRLGMYLYVTIREDRGPRYSDLCDNILLKEGEYVYQLAKLPLPLTLYKWRDSVKYGSWFISTCHDDTKYIVFRRKRGINNLNKQSHGKEAREAPLCIEEYNKYMGAVDRSNALRAGSSMQLKHKYRWYMCLIYYCLDSLLINSYLVYKFRFEREYNKTA